ncbi:hypothetical protein Ciccas_005153 [Cichlidogyrus casuarinus]|uniref:Mitochondrial ribosomal protein S15 n=1 Tax=Cichlidogyrus casuarinus TaxID=1844966 RepID=A0ABD2QAF0_9PLAT
MLKKYEYLNYRDRIFKELSYQPHENNIATKVIDLTVKLRYKKSILQANPRNYPLRCATEGLIHQRYRALAHLRSRNLKEFDRVTKALGITKFCFQNPFDQLILDEKDKRIRAVSEDCYKERLAKIARLKNNMAKDRDTFQNEIKPQKLGRVRELLTSLSDTPLSDERLEQLLSSVFQEVLTDRRYKLLEGPMKDELFWYHDEERQRQKVQRVIAEKAARRGSQKR